MRFILEGMTVFFLPGQIRSKKKKNMKKKWKKENKLEHIFKRENSSSRIEKQEGRER